MIDYHANVVAYNAFVSALSAASFADPQLGDAQSQTLGALTSAEGEGLLGALVHHLVAHAVSDGAELTSLREASTLWDFGVQVAHELGTLRAEVEWALENPKDPAAASRFNTASVKLQELSNDAIGTQAAVDNLRNVALTFAHLPPHPCQADLPTDTWDWSNLILGRRTEALVRNLHARANSPATLAFANGAITAYAANAAGSPYVGHVVGGPRRSHRYRDRIARNAVGNWLAVHHPQAQPLASVAQRVAFGSPVNPVLPVALQAQVIGALEDTFDLASTQPLPDVQLGFRRLIEHLTLLDGFHLPQEPTPPGQTWMTVLYANSASPPPSLRPQDVDIVGQDDGGVGVHMGPPEPGTQTAGDSDSTTAKKGCGIAVLIIILADLVQAFVQCIGQWANGNTCTYWDNMLLSDLWEEDPPDPRDPSNPNTTSSELTAVAANPQAAQLVHLLHDAHLMVWEALDRAHSFLVSTGFIYPDDKLTSPAYAQFTAVPPVELWPYREEPVLEDTYHLYPTFRLEEPLVKPSPFDIGERPDSFIASSAAMTYWALLAQGLPEDTNLDLDGDRGASHPCWRAGGSVRDDPIDVVVLGYSDQ